VTIPQLDQLFSNHFNTNVEGRYLSVDVIKTVINSFTQDFDITIIGKSVFGLPIHKISFGTGQKRLLCWSQMHGNESTTTKAIFDILNVFANSEDESINYILKTCKITIIPVLNPDGAKAYTRENANGIDLNRDAQALTQPESKVLRATFDSFKPDFCFNLHGQRTIFSAGDANNSSVLSFLAPAQDKDLSVTPNRKVAMDLIYRIYNMLQAVIPEQVGIYDDAFNLSCVGDTFQSMGVPTLLFEAGHFPGDYRRETTRKLIFKALLYSITVIARTNDLGRKYKPYFNIPQNKKLFRDIIIRNALINNEIKDVVIQYKEQLKDDKIEFQPIIETIDYQVNLFSHREIDANSKEISANSKLEEGNEIVFVEINDEKFSFLP